MLVEFKGGKKWTIVLSINDAAVLLLMLCEKVGLVMAEVCNLRKKNRQ